MIEHSGLVLLTIGGVLLAGYLADAVGRLTAAPRVTVMILFGVAAGPMGFDLLPVDIGAWYELTADVALVMVGFVLGLRLDHAQLARFGRAVFSVSACEVLGIAVLMALGMIAVGVPVELALLLGGIAPASAPAAIRDVIAESRAEGPFTEIVIGVVAIDDAWGLIVFSLMMAMAQAWFAETGAASALLFGLQEVGGALLLGFAVGIPAAVLTGRVSTGEPTRIEALGLVFLCGGAAILLGVSFLLAAMTMGATIANLARHHERPRRAIESFEQPFLVLFFILAGAALEIGTLAELGLVGGTYILLRFAGLWIGGWLGAQLAGMRGPRARLIGLAITPQAGVALGMALVAKSRFPEIGETLLAIVIGTTVVFELIGPVITRWTLISVGEIEATR